MINKLSQFIDTLFDHSKNIPISVVSFDDEVRKLCEQNMCGNFRKSWTCPPAVDPVETLKSGILRFERFLIIDKVYTLEDSFDWEGMVSSAKDFQLRILKLKKEIRKIAPESDFLILGAGACKLCETCTYIEDKPCRNPDDALFSLEANGIDAMKMMRDNDLKYNNGPDTVTYIGGVFHH